MEMLNKAEKENFFKEIEKHLDIDNKFIKKNFNKFKECKIPKKIKMNYEKKNNFINVIFIYYINENIQIKVFTNFMSEHFHNYLNDNEEYFCLQNNNFSNWNQVIWYIKNMLNYSSKEYIAEVIKNYLYKKKMNMYTIPNIFILDGMIRNVFQSTMIKIQNKRIKNEKITEEVVNTIVRQAFNYFDNFMKE